MSKLDMDTPEFSANEQELIDKEFTRLERNQSTYLDHAGTTLYAESQVAHAAVQLHRDVISNPHTSRSTGDYVDQVRFKILEFFHTQAEDYEVIFTANASAALRLVAEHFDFGDKGNFHYCQENHTSVLGMRQMIQANGTYMLRREELSELREGHIRDIMANGSSSTGNSLVVFSAQCNFSGYKMPLETIQLIQDDGLPHLGKLIAGQEDNGSNGTTYNYYVCLDAASYAATNPLDLQKYKPDFVCLSFYKIFGYPTGVGALLVSRRGAELLSRARQFYGGGTINYAYAHAMDYKLRDTSLHERFEDGTLPFLSIVELLEGFRSFERLIPTNSNTGISTMDRVSRHVFTLARYLENQLKQLKYANGQPLIQFYNHQGYEDRSKQGGIVAFNVRTESGGYVGFAEIACVASLHGILLRTGCFCNVGACQRHLQLDDQMMDIIYKRSGRVCGDYNDLIDGQPTGAVRVSFGYMTRISDARKLVEMLEKSYLSTRSPERWRFIEKQASQLPKALQQRAQSLRPRLLELAIFPVKSCAALKAKKWPLTAQGLKYDREWMIVDRNGLALTQKRCTGLCLIQPSIEKDNLILMYDGDINSSISLPLFLSDDDLQAAARCRSKICRQPIEGSDCGEQVAQWLDQNLGLDGLRLLRQSTQRTSSSHQLSLVNQAQFLLVNRSSVRSLQFEEPLDETVDRFRANLIIDTGAPFDELDYTSLSIGRIYFKVEGPCQRCDMICINQRTGERSPETLTTIARLQKGKMRFGIYITRLTEEEDNLDPHKEHHLICGEALEVD
ncbi:molybdenum cofactor sulfurase [Drosophila tropicalis]|uniref:molybdenum cofactor sulfurase n=1 Tax=Drosophila tropicalis TaxID=46794 RepID=UPI0035ABAD68